MYENVKILKTKKQKTIESNSTADKKSLKYKSKNIRCISNKLNYLHNPFHAILYTREYIAMLMHYKNSDQTRNTAHKCQSLPIYFIQNSSNVECGGYLLLPHTQNCEHSKPMYSLEGRLNNSINHATEHGNFLFKKIKN